MVQRREGRSLGSPLRLLVEGRIEPARIDAAWDAVHQEFDAVDRTMSRFREDSEITALHRTARALVAVSPRLRAALALADRARRSTGGAFDAGIVIDLERLGSVGVRQGWPGASRAPNARAHAIGPSRDSFALLSPIDLGGIGKGLALRWAARRAAGILGSTGFLLEAGGDIATRGTAGGEAWSVGIEDPAGEAAPVATCVLPADWAIATSSIRRAFWHDAGGRTVHHLIDPRTGAPGGDGLVAVTVTGPDPAWAEIWSKALFLEGPSNIALAARSRGLAAWWVGEGGSVSMTPAARQLTVWVRSESRYRPRQRVEGDRPRAGAIHIRSAGSAAT